MAIGLSWKQTSPKLYEREVDLVERFYLSAAAIKSPIVKKADWHLNCGIKLECERPNFTEAVRQAWLQTRYDHPGLAAVVEDDRWVYRVADESELASWLAETFVVHRMALTARELMSEPDLLPGPRVVLHVLPNTKELMVQGPHTHLDGFGLMKTFQSIISNLVRQPLTGTPATAVRFGDEGKNLTPPMSLACATPALSDADKAKWDALLDGYIAPENKLYLSTRNESDPAGLSRTQWLVWDGPSTTRVQQAMQKEGLSLAAIAQTAVSLAAREHGSAGSTQGKHATQGLYSAREYIDPTIADGDHMVSPLVLGVPLVYELHDSFVDTAASASKTLQYGKEDGFGLKCGHLWGSDLPKAFAAPMPEGRLIRADAQMSYMGHMDAYLQEWNEDDAVEGSLTQCVDYWSSLDMLSANVVTGVYIFRGKLNVSLAYNETYHSEESMTRFLNIIKDTIDSGLQVQTTAVVRSPGQEEWMPETFEI